MYPRRQMWLITDNCLIFVDNNVSTQTDVADEEVLRHRHTDVMMVPQPLTSSNTLPLPPRPQNQQSQQKKTPKSTIAVRAMELETRKQYPELSKSVPDHKMHGKKHLIYTPFRCRVVLIITCISIIQNT